jgi:hypothetical protein
MEESKHAVQIDTQAVVVDPKMTLLTDVILPHSNND